MQDELVEWSRWADQNNHPRLLMALLWGLKASQDRDGKLTRKRPVTPPVEG